MNKNTEHTPTPWIVRPFEHREKGVYQIRHETPYLEDGQFLTSVIATTSDQITDEHGGTPKTNADFIVRAVNSHEELLEAAKFMQKALDDDAENSTHDTQMTMFVGRDMLSNAIAKAEGEVKP